MIYKWSPESGNVYVVNFNPSTGETCIVSILKTVSPGQLSSVSGRIFVMFEGSQRELSTLFDPNELLKEML